MASFTLDPCTAPEPHAETHRDWSVGGVVLIVVACLAVEGVGGLAAGGSGRSWHLDLSGPAWAPPDWAFGPAWSVQYALMALAGSVVWLARDRDDVSCPLAAFGLQLAANLGWTLLFFGLHSPLAAFLGALLLWAAVGLTVVHFFGVSRLAGWLLVPYWALVTYAALLNGSIVAMT